jgi:hypothetical protein
MITKTGFLPLNFPPYVQQLLRSTQKRFLPVVIRFLLAIFDFLRYHKARSTNRKQFLFRQLDFNVHDLPSCLNNKHPTHWSNATERNRALLLPQEFASPLHRHKPIHLEKPHFSNSLSTVEIKRCTPQFMLA